MHTMLLFGFAAITVAVTAIAEFSQPIFIHALYARYYLLAMSSVHRCTERCFVLQSDIALQRKLVNDKVIV